MCTGCREISRTVAIPGSIGVVATITSNNWRQYCEHSHIPVIAEETSQGLSADWHPCDSAGPHPALRVKLAILGGNVGMSGESITDSQCLFMAPRLYPVGLVRHILRETRNHFRSNLPSDSTRGRAGVSRLTRRCGISPRS